MNFLQYLLEKDEEYKKWVTIFPGRKNNRERGKGIHVLINGKDGTILGGMGGKFDGENIKDVAKDNKNNFSHDFFDKKIESAKKYSLKVHDDLDAIKFNLTEDEKNSIYEYTGFEYASMNDYLRGIREKVDENIKKYIANIDNVFDKITTKENFVVYRGMYLDDETLKIYANSKPGDTIEDKGFVSTSTNPNKSFGGNVKMEIIVPKGSKAMSVKNLSYEDEEEILLNRGGKFKVIKNEKNGKNTKLSVVYISED